ncbi:hypothetical protein DWY69_05085 [Eisenbergiella massiliensis]|uniref:Uncharacterized protein n=1 Tax=Eisenbergiella massiliensis TaxID=1720294 RepID=A0A3E3J2N4_9FIRM|nr:hypothetical protein DWY69_05085 [Eisenbergiella massiliensis]
MDSISFHHSGFAEIKLPVAAYHVILMIAGRPCQKGLTDQLPPGLLYVWKFFLLKVSCGVILRL